VWTYPILDQKLPSFATFYPKEEKSSPSGIKTQRFLPLRLSQAGFGPLFTLPARIPNRMIGGYFPAEPAG